MSEIFTPSPISDTIAVPVSKTIHVVQDGAIVDAMVVPVAAVIADKGASVSWGDTTLDAPQGSAFAAVEGGAIGYGWNGKTATPPALPPAPPPGPRAVRGVLLVKALDKTTKVCSRDLAYVVGLDAAREDMPSIVRIAGVDGRKVSEWFDLALGTAP